MTVPVERSAVAHASSSRAPAGRQRVDAPGGPGSIDVPLRRDESFRFQPPQQPVEVAEVHLGAVADEGRDVLQQVVAVAWAFVQQQQQCRFDEPFDPSSHRPLTGV